VRSRTNGRWDGGLLLLLFMSKGVRIRLCTAGTNGSIVHPPDDMKPRWNDIDREKSKNSEKNMSHCHFVHHKSYMD
jgi:hypothetical protein